MAERLGANRSLSTSIQSAIVKIDSCIRSLPPDELSRQRNRLVSYVVLGHEVLSAVAGTQSIFLSNALAIGGYYLYRRSHNDIYVRTGGMSATNNPPDNRMKP